MPSKKHDKSQEDAKASESKNLLDGLESLLAEEGIKLEEEDSDVDIDVLLSDDDDPPAAHDASSVVPRSRSPQRTSRASRRNQDRAAFDNVAAQMQKTALSIEVDEHQLTATLAQVTQEVNYEEIIRFIRSKDICFGIDYEGIRSAVHAAHRGQIISGLVVARGRPMRVTKQASVVYHLPPETMDRHNISDKMTDFEILQHIMEGPHLEAIRSYRGVVKPVKPGDVISRILPAEFEAGETVFGSIIEPDDDDDIHLPMGDNTDLSDDGFKCVAAIYGYAGIIDGTPTVLPPVWVSPDNMVANFVYIPPPEGRRQPVPSIEDLHFLLEVMWVTNGVMEKQIELIQQRLKRGHSLPSVLPIAEGTHAVAGDDAQIHYAFDIYSVPAWNMIDDMLSLQTAEAISDSLAALYERPDALPFSAVVTGQTVIEKSPATQGLIGATVQGEEVTAEPGSDLEIEEGAHLSVDEGGLRCRADCFGYICLKWDVQVMVLSPIWVTPDKRCAYFLNLPQKGTPAYPKLDEIQVLLKEAGVVYGFDPQRWIENRDALLRGELTDYLILLAEGEAAEMGRDASFEWEVNVQDEKRIGKFLEDGSIDFRERDLITLVQQDDILGRLIPPKPGLAGRDIFGNELPPPPQINIEVTIDSRIYAEPESDGIVAFFAGSPGGISMRTKDKEKDGRISRRIDIGINAISKIPGDVDYTTGNIEFNGDVLIEGSVQQQFSVRSTGSVTIGGYVEAGAYITAGKNIIVKRGIIGASTELIAGGSITAKYAQEATLRAGSDVRIGSHIFNASVRAGGQVVVSGKGEGKSRALVGGLAWGGRGILARSIGSPYNTSTRLVAGVNPESLERIEQIRTNIHACNQKQASLLANIGIPSKDVGLIKQKLSYCRDAEEKQKILMTVKRIAKVAELVKSLEDELDEIAEMQRKLSLRTSINVHGTLFSGVEMRIGELTQSISDDQQHIGYRIVQEEEEQTIQMGPYRANR